MQVKKRFRSKSVEMGKRLAERLSRHIAAKFNKKKIEARLNSDTENFSKSIADEFRNRRRHENRSHSLQQRRADEVCWLYFEKGLTQKEVAERLNISKRTVRRIFKNHGWKIRSKIDANKVHRLYFDERLTQQDVAKKLGVSVHTIYRIFQKYGWESRYSTRKKELDENDVRHLYFKENLSQEEVAKKLGVSESTMNRFFRKHEIKSRRISSRRELDNEVYRLYFEKKLTQEETAKTLGISKRTVIRLFQDLGWKARHIKVDEYEVQRLYFDKGLTQKEIAEKLGVSRGTINRIFKTHDWKIRRISRHTNVDADEVHRLYYDEKLTQKQIATRLAVSKSTISKIFKDHKWEARRGIRPSEVDKNEVHRLYYDEKLTQKEVAEKLRVSRRTISSIFKNHEWKIRTRAKYKKRKEKKSARKRNAKQFRLKLIKLRENLFGTECKICRERRKLAIHKKDGNNHDKDALWRLGYLNSLNRDEWAALCIPCHRGVHWMMDRYSVGWNRMEFFSEEKRNSGPEIKEPLELPDSNIPSSERYLELKDKYGDDTEALRRAIFGERCHFCDIHYEEKRVVIHRKDGRPHGHKLIDNEQYFRTLNPENWVSLCQKHHRLVHWAMNRLGLKWEDLE